MQDKKHMFRHLASTTQLPPVASGQ